MNVLDIIRDRIRILYKTNPNIHVNVTLKRPYKTKLNNLAVVIKGVYPHMFQVEDSSEGVAKLHMHSYTEIVTKEVEILELSDITSQNVDQK
ncbi:MAG: hypothetical protein IJ198_03075 [Lachnospiraceae bacterium]|nr:hypothetical protein [Lachnospiraceae bacterium]